MQRRYAPKRFALEVPGGRSITTLINLTPIPSEEGQVESVIVTLQDMAPLEQLERSRAEFLSLVSHELRVPLSSIKGLAATVKEVSPDPAEMAQFFRIIEQQADHMRGLISDLLDAGRIEAGTLSVTAESTDVARPGGPGQEHLPERGRPPCHPDRSAARPAPGAG